MWEWGSWVDLIDLARPAASVVADHTEQGTGRGDRAALKGRPPYRNSLSVQGKTGATEKPVLGGSCRSRSRRVVPRALSYEDPVLGPNFASVGAPVGAVCTDAPNWV